MPIKAVLEPLDHVVERRSFGGSPLYGQSQSESGQRLLDFQLEERACGQLLRYGIGRQHADKVAAPYAAFHPIDASSRFKSRATDRRLEPGTQKCIEGAIGIG